LSLRHTSYLGTVEFQAFANVRSGSDGNLITPHVHVRGWGQLVVGI